MPDVAIQVLCIGNGAEEGSGKDEANAGNVQPLGVLKVESPQLFHNLAGVNSGQLCLKSVVEL